MSRQGGFSLIELLVVVALISVAIASIIGVYTLVQASARANETSQNVLIVQDAIRRMYPTPSYPATMTATPLIASGRLPKRLVSGATTLVTPWGGNITIAGNQNYNGGTGNAYLITLTQTPKSICVDVATTLERQFPRMIVGSTTIKDDSAGTVFDVANLAGACNTATGVSVALTGSG